MGTTVPAVKVATALSSGNYSRERLEAIAADWRRGTPVVELAAAARVAVSTMHRAVKKARTALGLTEVPYQRPPLDYSAIRRLATAGVPREQIAREMGRSRAAVDSALWRLAQRRAAQRAQRRLVRSPTRRGASRRK